jgi:hypothetical protein
MRLLHAFRVSLMGSAVLSANYWFLELQTLKMGSGVNCTDFMAMLIDFLVIKDKRINIK